MNEDRQTLVEFAQGETSGGKLSSLPSRFVRASTTRQIVLPPSGSLSIPVTGTRFYITEQNSGTYIGIKTEKTVEEMFTVGTGKAFPDDQYFTNLEIRNLSATLTVTLTLFAGFGDYIDRRLTVVDDRFNSTINVREAATRSLARTSFSIPGVTTVTFNTVPAWALRRKAFLISNMDLANSLLLQDNAGNPGLAVFPSTSITVPISAEVRVSNITASAIVCYITEIFYTL